MPLEDLLNKVDSRTVDSEEQYHQARRHGGNIFTNLNGYSFCIHNTVFKRQLKSDNS